MPGRHRGPGPKAAGIAVAFALIVIFELVGAFTLVGLHAGRRAWAAHLVTLVGQVQEHACTASGAPC